MRSNDNSKEELVQLQEFREQEQEQWTNLTYILDNTGNMKINYRYDDISEISPVEKQDKWEAEYLKSTISSNNSTYFYHGCYRV